MTYRGQLLKGKQNEAKCRS